MLPLRVLERRGKSGARHGLFASCGWQNLLLLLPSTLHKFDWDCSKEVNEVDQQRQDFSKGLPFGTTRMCQINLELSRF